MNTSKCKRFKDTWAAPGSQLYAALEDGDRKKAEAIYNECEAVNAKLEREGRRKTLMDGLLSMGIPLAKNPYAVVRSDMV